MHWLDAIIARARRKLLRSWQIDTIVAEIAEHCGETAIAAHPHLREATEAALGAAWSHTPPLTDLETNEFIRTKILEFLTLFPASGAELSHESRGDPPAGRPNRGSDSAVDEGRG